MSWRHQASGLTGRFPLSSFCGGTSFCFLETEFEHLFSCVNCADLPSGPCLGSAAELTETFEELVDSTLFCVRQLLQILFHPLLKQTCQQISKYNINSDHDADNVSMTMWGERAVVTFTTRDQCYCSAYSLFLHTLV